MVNLVCSYRESGEEDTRARSGTGDAVRGAAGSAQGPEDEPGDDSRDSRDSAVISDQEIKSVSLTCL